MLNTLPACKAYDRATENYVTIAVGSFVMRQKKGSGYSYYDGPWCDVVKFVADAWSFRKPGYRDGVTLVRVPSCCFYTSTVQATECAPKLRAICGARREGEKPYVKVFGQGCEPLPARYVQVVCYRRDVLEEGGDTVPEDVDWTIISVNASAQEDEPMTPVTMARNFLGEQGGTKAEYTAQQFAESIWYWMDKVQLDPSEGKGD